MDAITYESNTILKLEKNNRLAYFNIQARSFIWKESGF